MSTNGRSTILFIDDEPDILECLTMIMKGEGYNILTALDPATALAMPELSQVDAIFSDFRMEKSDGIEFLKALRISGHDIPVVFITGHTSTDIVKSALQLGAIDFIDKPFNPNTIKDVSTRIIEIGVRKREAQRIIDIAQNRTLTHKEATQLKRHQRSIELLKICNFQKRSS